jgi:DNA (cytosine-5)-methyltransferase 1
MKRWMTVRDALRGLPEPVDFTPHPRFANHVGNPGARAYPGHTGSPWDEPAKTLKAGDHGVPGGENMLRRDDGTVRYFSVREAARLQTFPDEYVFQGAWSEGFRQLGNAVPVELAHAVASEVRRLLDGAKEPQHSSERVA